MSVNTLSVRQRAQSTVSLRRRMIRTVSEDKGSQLKKSATMTSFRPKLERMIQEGKIEQLMNQDPSSKARLFYTNHVNEMDNQLSSTKKSLSALVIKSRGKQQTINTLKNSIKKIEHQIEVIKKQAFAASHKKNGTSGELTSKKNEFEQIYWDEKMFENLKTRGYKDEVFLKGKYEELQRVFQIQNDNRVLLQNKYHEIKQLNKELNSHKNEAEKILREQAIDKNEFIALVERDLSQRELLGELKAEKYKREGQINQIAASLIQREQLQRIMQVFYAHIILSQIIKVKTNNLLIKYDKVNKAYNYIKSNSNILEPDKILKRMEEHDKLYDDALKRVSALEAQLVSLEANLEGCTLSKNTILSQEGEHENIPSNYYQGLQKDKYELMMSDKQKIQHRNIEDQVLRLNIMQWADRMFGRFSINQNESNDFFDCLTDLVVMIRQQK